MKLKISTVQVMLLAACFLLPSLVHAQPGFGDDVDDVVPVDGGLSLLVAAGVGYGIKKSKKKKSCASGRIVSGTGNLRNVFC